MSLSTGAKAKRFLQPGGANAVFARRRGMIAPAPLKQTKVEADPNSRFGKASGRDYSNFFSKKKNVSVLQKAINALKNLLVETFIAAKSLSKTIKNIIKQVKGLNKGGGGIFGKLGMIGLVAAVVAGVAAIFGPKIKEVFDNLKAGANGIFENIKGFLEGINQKVKGLYNLVRDAFNNINGWIDGFNNKATTVLNGAFSWAQIPFKLPVLKPYKEEFGEGGINPLAGKTLSGMMGDLGSSIMSGTGNMLMGAFDGITGVMGDLVNNLLSSLGLTEQANAVTDTLGLGSPFGASRQVGSGPGARSAVENFFGGGQRQTSTSSSGATGGSQSQMEVAQTLVTEFKAQGLSSEGAKLATAEIGRENSLNVNTILGTHDDGGVTAYGAISWQGGREQVLFDELQSRGISPTKEGLAASGDEGIKANAAAMIREMSSGSEAQPELLRLLKKQTLTDAEKDKVRQLMKDRYFRYDPTIPIQRSRDWYDRVNSFGLQSMVQTAPPETQIPSARTNSNNIAMVMPGGQQVAQPQPRSRPTTINPNGAATNGPDYVFPPSTHPDSYDVTGMQLGIAIA